MACSTNVAGRYRHRLLLQRDRGTVRDELGQTQTNWTTVASLWGQVEPKTGRETVRSESLHAETTHTVRLRYREGVTSRDRLLFGARVLNILSVINVDERCRELLIECVEEV